MRGKKASWKLKINTQNLNNSPTLYSNGGKIYVWNDSLTNWEEVNAN